MLKLDCVGTAFEDIAEIGTNPKKTLVAQDLWTRRVSNQRVTLHSQPAFLGMNGFHSLFLRQRVTACRFNMDALGGRLKIREKIR
jgi:hypothetical protein